MSRLDALENPLTNVERARIHDALRGLLEWQRELRHWVAPEPISSQISAAIPIVSVYARGALRGCFAYHEGPAHNRLTRAFLMALADSRFAPIEEPLRGELVLQVAYPIRARRIEPSAAESQFVAGVHGLALLHGDRTVLLVPDVARDLALDEQGFLRALEEKADAPRTAWEEDSLCAFETERVVARASAEMLERSTPLAGALEWLARQVQSDGSVRFALDSSTGEICGNGFMRHARAATLIQALGLDPRYTETRARAQRWLNAEVTRALTGVRVEDWPTEPALVAGSLALCCLAGLRLEDALLARAREPALLAEPWHAGQVAVALAHATPDALWQTCVSALEREAFAPWTAIAAHRRGDAQTFQRAVAALRENIPDPAVFGFVAEPALAALTAEALSLDEGSRREHAAALELLRQSQLWADNHPAASPEWIHGAFVVTPNQKFLRCDVTAHAALAFATATPG